MSTKRATYGERAVRSLDAPLTSTYKTLAAIGRLSQEAFSTVNAVVASEHVRAHRVGALLSPWPLDVSEIPGVPSVHRLTNTLWECSMEHALADMDAEEEAVAKDRDRSVCTIVLEDEPQDTDPQGSRVQAAVRSVCGGIAAKYFIPERVSTRGTRKRAKWGRKDDGSDEEDEDEDGDEEEGRGGVNERAARMAWEPRRPGLRPRRPPKTPAEKSLVVLPDRMRRAPAVRNSNGSDCSSPPRASRECGDAVGNNGVDAVRDNGVDGVPPSPEDAAVPGVDRKAKGGGGDAGASGSSRGETQGGEGTEVRPVTGSQYVQWAAAAGPSGRRSGGGMSFTAPSGRGRGGDESHGPLPPLSSSLRGKKDARLSSGENGRRSPVTAPSSGADGGRKRERGEAAPFERQVRGGEVAVPPEVADVPPSAGPNAGRPRRSVLSKKGQKRRDQAMSASTYPGAPMGLCVEALFADVLLNVCAAHKHGGHPVVTYADAGLNTADGARVDVIGGAAACRSVAADAVSRISNLVTRILDEANSTAPPAHPGDTQNKEPTTSGNGQNSATRQQLGDGDPLLGWPPASAASSCVDDGSAAAYRIIVQAQAAGFPQSVLDATCQRLGLPGSQSDPLSDI